MPQTWLYRCQLYIPGDTHSLFATKSPTHPCANARQSDLSRSHSGHQIALGPGTNLEPVVIKLKVGGHGAQELEIELMDNRGKHQVHLCPNQAR